MQLFQNGIQSDKHQEIIDCCELINKKSPKKLKQILVETIKLQKLFLDFHGSKQFIFHYLLMVIFSMITIGLQFWLLDYIFYGFYWKLGWELFINGKLEILQFVSSMLINFVEIIINNSFISYFHQFQHATFENMEPVEVQK